MKLLSRGVVAVASAVSLAAAQPPRVRGINLYGLHKVTAERILRATKLHVGDALPGSKGDLEDAVSEIPGVVQARVEAVCCAGPDVIVFIGIEERGGPHVGFRSDPSGGAALPDPLAAAYREYAGAVARAASGKPAVDTRDWRQQFASFAEEHPVELREVLREAAEPEQRAIAAAFMGFAPRKQDVVDDLQYAMQDPDEQVRDRVLDSLNVVALLAAKRPQLGLHVSPTWLIELLNSVVLNDRLQAVDVLITLTDQRNRAVLDQMRDRALPSLVEMARWETLRYALPPFLLVGRLAGLQDEQVQRRWSAGEREAVIAKALSHPSAKGRTH